MNTVQYDKLLSSLRYWLIGKAENDNRYYVTLDALEYSRQIHVGTRKDGTTEEFYHQLNIVSFLRNLVVHFEKPHILLAVGLLHDTIEDYEHTEAEVVYKFPDVYPYLEKINKMRNGNKLSYDDYFANMSGCPITVTVKCVDRIHNLSTMDGVFSVDKMQSYIDDVRDYFLPTLKETRRLQPKYEAVFELLKTTLLLMVSNVESIIRYERGNMGTNEVDSISDNDLARIIIQIRDSIVLTDMNNDGNVLRIYKDDIIIRNETCIEFSYNGTNGYIDVPSSQVFHPQLSGFRMSHMK